MSALGARARLVLAAFATLPLGAAACGGSAPRPVAPKDPSGLTKCKVAASQSSPLVTEWPASEKARLEGLLADGGVAVSYSGCEMRILDACTVDGTYGFHRTTLSTDTIEITDQDDLYAKLPLGAAALEGELSRSGRLAIRTTVAGQVKFKGDLAKAPASGACAKATHVVTAISVGAFRMLSGGSVSAGAGVDVAGVGAGGKSSRAEQTMRESGEPDKCSEASESGAHPNCNSPIQVFLTPLHKKPDQPGFVPPDEDQPPPNAVRVSFTKPDTEGTWSLNDGARTLCELPCSRWVPRDGNYVLQLDSDEGIEKVNVPRLEYAPGRKVDATLLMPRGSKGLGTASVVVGSIALGLGAITFAIAATAEAEDLLPIGGALAGGGAALLTTGIVVLAYSRKTHAIEFKIAGREEDAAAEPLVRFGLAPMATQPGAPAPAFGGVTGAAGGSFNLF